MLSYLPWFSIGVIAAFFIPTFPSYLYIVIYSIPVLIWIYGLTHPKFRKLAILAFGFCCAIFRIDLALHSRIDEETPKRNIAMQIEVKDLPEVTQHYQQFTAKVLDNHLHIRTILFRDYQKKQDWQPGSRWLIHANLKSSVGRVNIGGLNTEAWLLTQGLDGFGTILTAKPITTNDFTLLGSIKKHWALLKLGIQQRINQYHLAYPNGSALVMALTVGIVTNISPQIWETFRVLGLTHVISISGLHIGIIYVLILLLLVFIVKVVLRCRGQRYLPRTPIILIVWLSFIVSLAYALLAGFSIPTQRSLLMIAVVSYALVSRRYYSAWQVWWIALSIVLICNPLATLSVGFWLSFLLVASLLLIPYPHGKSKYFTYLVGLLSAEYATTIASIIPVGIFFYSFPVWGFVANLILVPWVTFIITPLAMLSVLLPFELLLEWSIFLTEKTLSFMELFKPYATVILIPQLPNLWVLLAVIASVVLIIPRGLTLRPWAILILSLILFYQPTSLEKNQAEITILDVGQGSSMLIETQNHSMLFDTGRQSAKNDLIGTLYAKNINSLDVLVLSHHDLDHDENWQAILQSFKVAKIFAGQQEFYQNQLPIPVNHCKRGLHWEWDQVHFEFLTTENGFKKISKNDQSCVLRIVVAEHALLVTGDLSASAEQSLVNDYGQRLFSNILIVGHHGSKGSTSTDFLEAVQPEYAVISSGYENSFHHPHPIILDRLKRFNIIYFRTDLEGSIRIQLGEGIKIAKIKNFQLYWQKKPFTK